MYRKGSVIEIQFPPERLNDAAGDPYWIDLTLDEARRLYEQLARSRPTHAPTSRSTRSRSTDLRGFTLTPHSGAAPAAFPVTARPTRIDSRPPARHAA